MTDRDAARQYFDRAAQRYTQRSSGLLWQPLRAWEARQILRLLDPQPGDRILDAGSGSGFYTRLIAAAGAHVTALDFAPEMLSVLRSEMQIETVLADFTRDPLPTQFNKVLCAGALEFVPDAASAVENLSTALERDKPGACLVVHLPIQSLGGRLYQRYHARHGVPIRLFTLPELDDIARGAGLRVAARRQTLFNVAARLEFAEAHS